MSEEMEINWIVVAVTFVVGAIAAYLIFGSKKKKVKSAKKADLPSADLLDSNDKTTSEPSNSTETKPGTFSQIERLEKPCKVEPRIIQFSRTFSYLLISRGFLSSRVLLDDVINTQNIIKQYSG